MEFVKNISEFFLTTEGKKLSLYLTTLFGSFVMYIFSFQKGFDGSIAVLKRLFPGKLPVFYDRLDFFLVVISGSFIGMILFIPTSHVQAFSAGLGWVGAITMVLRKQDKSVGGDQTGKDAPNEIGVFVQDKKLEIVQEKEATKVSESDNAKGIVKAEGE